MALQFRAENNFKDALSLYVLGTEKTGDPECYRLAAELYTNGAKNLPANPKKVATLKRSQQAADLRKKFILG
jgi:hypothetical protein